MKYILLLLIKLYQKSFFSGRQKCLFKESCSKHVYRITKEDGFVMGIKALYKRFKQCRSGYSAYKINDTEWVILKDKTVVNKKLTTI